MARKQSTKSKTATVDAAPAASPPKARPGQFTAMISSTALDLPKHREAAHKACIEAGVFPIEMEQLPARDASGIAVSLEMVDQADIYLGIYAFRYGWVPAGKNISITEMEYDRAVERKAQGELKEILIFLSHADHPLTAKDVEADAKAQKKLHEFKARATDGRGRREFSSPEELHRHILHALNEWKSTQARADAEKLDSSSPFLSTTTPNNLPRLQEFFGRVDELQKIREALDPENRTWGALIDGPGGMGKTSLAVRAAYDCPPGQFQRIVFVSVKTRELDDDGVRELGTFILPGFLEMLNELARELDHADITKAPEDQRIRLLLDALRPAQALLILDNLESLPKSDRDQLFTFVKRLPQGCKAILTSRRRIGSGSEELILEKLGQEAALETLADLAKRNKLLAKTSEAERITLYTQTAGKPLLLRWVAGQIGRGSCLTFTDALHFLSTCPPDNDPLEFIFGDLVQEFTEEETRALCALTYFTLPAKVKHIAELAEREETVIEPALRSLTNRSLVVPEQEENAYALVPMVAEFLRRRKPEVVKETGDRLEKWAYALVMENGDEKHARFPVLDAAWQVIEAALPRFLAGSNDRLQEVCDALDSFLHFTGRLDEQLALSQKAEAKAVAAKDLLNAGWRAYDAGWVCSQRGQATAVVAWADRAADAWREFGAGTREKAAALQLLGRGKMLSKDYHAAIAACEEALDIFRSLDSQSRDVAAVLDLLASAQKLAGNFDTAENHHREALRIARVESFQECIAIVTGNLAALALDRKNWAEAESLANEALTLAGEVGRLELIASNCHRLAVALNQQGKISEALPHAQRAVAIFTDLRSPDLAAARETLAECEADETGEGGASGA